MSLTDEIMFEFRDLIKKNVSIPVCAMKVLVTVIKKSESTTWMQLERELRDAIKVLKMCSSSDLGGRTKISLGSGCDLFMKYVTRAFLEFTVI
jgi:translation initiation factor eIF-2B subunit alpha